MTSAGEDGALSFERDIRPLFRKKDRDSMMAAFDLFDHTDVAAERAIGKAVTTVEGALGPVVDAVRDAWHRGNVVQCGYCQPAQTLAAVALLESDPTPDNAAIDNWMSGNICRCGTYPRIRAAIHEAALTLAAGSDPRPLTAPPEPKVDRLTPEEMADPVHPYVRVREDETILVFCSQVEMGQGIHTGFRDPSGRGT
jgi:isoquinoline 1-oxidoreductase beta subunit